MINILNTTQITKMYNELQTLKKALGIKKNQEVSKSLLLEKASNHNKKEIFSLEYVIEEIKNMPIEVKKHHKYLRENINNENFYELFKETEVLYKTNKIFNNYYKQISKELGFLEISKIKYYLNMLIFEIANEEINDYSIFSIENPVVNLFYLEKWLRKHSVSPVIKLTHREKIILEFYTQGYIDEEFKFNKLASNIGYDDFQYTTEYILPKKFNAQNITQVLALYFYKL